MKPAEIKIGKTYKSGNVRRKVIKFRCSNDDPVWIFYREFAPARSSTSSMMLDNFAKWAEEVVDG